MRIGFKEWMKDPAKCMERVNRYNSKKLDYNRLFWSQKYLALQHEAGRTIEENDDEFILYDENGKVIQRFKKNRKMRIF